MTEKHSHSDGTIYIDQDADIASIVSKLSADHHKHIKLVVPKNCPALRSGVNLKLLYRTAHTKSKEVSLVTSDQKLIAMATAARIPTAPSLDQEPILPNKVDLKLATTDDIEPDKQPVDVQEDLTLDSSDLNLSNAKPTGDEKADLNPDLAVASIPKKRVGRSDKKDEANKKSKDGAAAKLPNFESFRKKALIIGGVVFLLLIILFLFFNSRKSAILDLRAKAKKVDVSLSVKLNADIDTSTKEQLKVSGYSGSKTAQASAPATGEQNIGQKASGKLTVINCTDNSVSISAGTGFSSNGQTFISAGSVSIPASNFFSNGSCKKDGTASVNVTAKEVGDQFNGGNRAFSVAGVSSSITAQGSTAGGTNQIIKVVSQADLDSLKSKLGEANQNEYKQELIGKVPSNQKALEDTFKVKVGEAQFSASVGQQADQVNANATTEYSMNAIADSELAKVVALAVEDQKDSPNQTVLKDGADQLKLSVQRDGTYALSTVAYLGPNIDQDAIKAEIAGKKKGEALETVNKKEGISGSKLSIKPFWSSTVPGKTDHIKINIEIDQTGI